MKTEWLATYNDWKIESGPVMFGLAVGLSAAEIEEALEADPQQFMDPAESEKANRPVWVLGMVTRRSSVTEDSGMIPTTGVFETINLKWSVIEGRDLYFWCYNIGPDALTTGSQLRLNCKHYGVWLRD